MLRIVQTWVLAAALVLGVSGAASAATLKGKVSKVDPTTKTFVVSHGKKDTSFSLAPDGKVVKGEDAKTLADLKVSDPVEVSYTLKNGKRIASQVQLGSGADMGAAPASRASKTHH